MLTMREGQYKPKHQQVADALRNEILSGEIAPGDKLGRYEDLMGRFGVARGTISLALRSLANEGLITSGRRGTPIRVRPQPTRTTMVGTLVIDTPPEAAKIASIELMDANAAIGALKSLIPVQVTFLTEAPDVVASS